MLLRLDPPIPIDTPKGPGLAYFLRDYSADHDDFWTVAIDATGEFWTFSNRDVRAVKNFTMGRRLGAIDTGVSGAPL